MNADLAMAIAGSFAGVCLGMAAFWQVLVSQSMRWRERFGQDFSVGLRESFIYLDVDSLFQSHVWLLGAASAAALWLTGRPAAALAALLTVGLLPGLALSWMRRRRLQLLASQWPDAVLLVAAALRSGSSLSLSLALASNELPSPAGLEFKLSVREQRFGMSLDESMRNLERRIPIEGVSLFTAAVRIAQESGGNLAETLEQLARTLRQKATLEGKIESLTAQGRLQGWVMAFMPILVGAALFAIDAPSMQALFTTWQGLSVCIGVLALEGLGLRVIRRIVSIDV